VSLPIVLTAEAEADVEEAAMWYEQRSDGLGVRYVSRVREVLARVSDNPELCPEVHGGLRRAPVRRFPYGVFYRRREDRIEVVAVFHDRRNPSAWKRRAQDSP
jgi:plasmid stabilization system protein ParE